MAQQNATDADEETNYWELEAVHSLDVTKSNLNGTGKERIATSVANTDYVIDGITRASTDSEKRLLSTISSALEQIQAKRPAQMRNYLYAETDEEKSEHTQHRPSQMVWTILDDVKGLKLALDTQRDLMRERHKLEREATRLTGQFDSYHPPEGDEKRAVIGEIHEKAREAHTLTA